MWNAIQKKSIMEEREETVDADLWSVLLSSCWWSIQVGFGIWEPDPGLLLPGRVPHGTRPPHTSIFHHHPPLFPPLLRWAPNGTLDLDGEVSALFHPQDSWKGPHPVLVSLKYALVAIGWCTVQKIQDSVLRKWCQLTGTWSSSAKPDTFLWRISRKSWKLVPAFIVGQRWLFW